MGMTMRVSLPGYDAGTDTNLDHFALHADADNVLIKEFQRGTVNVTGPGTSTVTHSLGYVPMVAAFRFVSPNWFFMNGNNYNQIQVGTGNIKLINSNPSGTLTFSYYIFYDQQV